MKGQITPKKFYENKKYTHICMFFFYFVFTFFIFFSKEMIVQTQIQIKKKKIAEVLFIFEKYNQKKIHLFSLIQCIR